MVNRFTTFLKNLTFVVRPRYWLMNYQYSKSWDIKLNKLLDEHTFTIIGRHTAKLGPIDLWISNYPYGSYRNPSYICRPSRLTIIRCCKKLKKDQYNINNPPKINKISPKKYIISFKFVNT